MTGGAFRRPQGGRIDRGRTLRFTFNGRAYTGFEGDTLASALLANGVHLVARSFKYHRPRGIIGAGAEETNAFVRLGRGDAAVPNALATMVELSDGIEARSVHCWPSLGFDVGAVNQALSPFLAAGFYYKTFMWPAQLWPLYERLLRAGAGLDRPPAGPACERHEHRADHYDVVVVGAGPAGLMAARAASSAGATVLLLDRAPEPGGTLLARGAMIDGLTEDEWLAQCVAELRARSNVRMLSRTVAAGLHDHGLLIALERVRRPGDGPWQRLWKIRARRIVLAPGAVERPLVFANNDRPGVMLASAARTYANRFAVRAGKRAVVLANNDTAYGAARDLHEAGVHIAAIVDLRRQPAGAEVESARELGMEIIAGSAVIDVTGARRVRAATIAPLRDGHIDGPDREIECDLVLHAGGWTPSVQLFAQAGGRLRFDEVMSSFLPAGEREGLRVVGAASGALDLGASLRGGWAAGREAAAALALRDPGPCAAIDCPPSPAPAVEALWRVPARSATAKRFVDLHGDVTDRDIALAAREGYRSAEHLKRYTTCGMGPDQGRTSNVNALAILAEELGAPITEVGTTTFRPPVAPIAFAAIAGRRTGRLYQPLRKSPLYGWHEAHGAVLEPAGPWKRPDYYPRAGETMAEAVNREFLAVRNAAGITDSSSLGKIEVRGSDAGGFLDRVYTNLPGTLGVGKCRYGLMLGEDGFVLDDGVVTRIAGDHFLLTTTTGGAAKVFEWLEEWLQCEWPSLDVTLVSVTSQWATIAVAGPNARLVLEAARPDFDLSDAAFPHMSMVEGEFAGIPVRASRISFTGERSYEINVAAGHALDLWERLIAAGAPFGLAPFGLEAMMALRAEKGFIVDGVDTDATTTPFDLGMGWIVSKGGTDFIGKRSLSRSALTGSGRRQLVGLLAEDANAEIPAGSVLVADTARRPPVDIEGMVTSAYFSPRSGRWFALAMLAGGRERLGERLRLYESGRNIPVRVTEPCFYDRAGARLRG